jgi:uncharacterized membrane protein YccC
MHELRQQDSTAQAEIVAGLIADLGRSATTADQLAVEQIAALTIHARRLERRGSFDKAAAIRDQITRATRAFGVAKPQPAKPAPRKTFVQRLEEEQAARREAEAVR